MVELRAPLDAPSMPMMRLLPYVKKKKRKIRSLKSLSSGLSAMFMSLRRLKKIWMVLRSTLPEKNWLCHACGRMTIRS